MKKILIVSTVSRQFYLFEKENIKILESLGYEVHGAANFNDANKRLNELNIIRHHFDIVRSPFSLKNIKAYYQLKSIMESGKFDAVHCHSPMGGVLARLVAKKVGVNKVIYTAHGFHFYKNGPMINWLLYYPIEKWLSKYTNTLITINNEDYMIATNKKFKSDNIKMIHGIGIDINKINKDNGKNKEQIRRDYGFKNSDFILFYAAELNSNKNQDVLIDAVYRLKLEIPDLKLLLAGRGELHSNYERKIKELGLEENVHLLGYRNDIQNLLALSDVAVASSKREGLPVNVMEAMAARLPLVVTDVRGHRDLVHDGINGYVVRVDDIDSFAQSIKKLYQSEKRRYDFGENGLKLVQKYSSSNIFKEMKSVYCEVLNEY